MAASDLCLLADVKSWLNLGDDATSDDVLLARLITAESERIVQYTNRESILARDFTIAFSGTGHSSMVFAQFPINSVAAVSLNGQPVAASAAGGAGGAGYNFGKISINLIGAVFPKGSNNCSVTFNAGFATVPADIEQACIELVCFRYRERDRIGHVSKSLGGETVTFTTSEMPASVREKLRNYVRVTTPALGL